jgi:hypothetical protein
VSVAAPCRNSPLETRIPMISAISGANPLIVTTNERPGGDHGEDRE